MNKKKTKKINLSEVRFIKSYFIACMPTENTYEEMPVGNKYIDDKILIIDNTLPRKTSYIFGAILIIIAAFYTYYVGEAYLLEPELDIIILLLITNPPLVFGIHGIKYLHNPIRKFTFHRLTGMVDVPKRGYKGWKGATNTVDYLQLDFVNAGWRSFYTSVNYPNAPFMFSPLLFHSYDGCNTTSREVYAFINWYMDKNRQLPPGKALDPYRMKDYLRREAEGFPEPIYIASKFIKIPDRKIKPEIDEEVITKDKSDIKTNK